MQYITLTEATALLPSSRVGKKLHVNTVKRWTRIGCRGVILAAVKIGDGWFTTERWLQEFQTNCTRAAMPQRDQPKELRREARRNAKKRLAKYGIYVQDGTQKEAVSEAG